MLISQSLFENERLFQGLLDECPPEIYATTSIIWNSLKQQSPVSPSYLGPGNGFKGT